MSSEADSLVVLIDKIDEDIGDWLVLEEPDTELYGLEPDNKTVVVFKHLSYEPFIGISSYSHLQGIFTWIRWQIHTHVKGDADIIVHERSIGLQFGFGVFGVLFLRIASQFNCGLH